MTDSLQHHKLQQYILNNKLTIITSNLNSISNKINTDMSTLNKLQEEVNKLKKTISELDIRILHNKLQKEVNELKKTISELEETPATDNRIMDTITNNVEAVSGDIKVDAGLVITESSGSTSNSSTIVLSNDHNMSRMRQAKEYTGISTKHFCEISTTTPDYTYGYIPIYARQYKNSTNQNSENQSFSNPSIGNEVILMDENGDTKISNLYVKINNDYINVGDTLKTLMGQYQE